jgi:hypothetical protein
MTECAYCRAETDLYENGVPVCHRCSTTCIIRETLIAKVLEATATKSDAFREFEAVMLLCPSGVPHPDGVQRIKNASNNLTVARKEMARAYARLVALCSRRYPANMFPMSRLKEIPAVIDNLHHRLNMWRRRSLEKFSN